MSGRARMLLADGRFTTARKTLARRTHTLLEDRPDTRLMILLPPLLALYSPGPTGIPGVSIQPGPMVVAAGKHSEWAYKQLAKWLRLVLPFQEIVLPIAAERGDLCHDATVCVLPDGVVEYPRGPHRKPLRFEP